MKIQTLPINKRWLLYAVLAAISIAAIACGGGGDEEDSSTDAGSESETQAQSSGNGGNSLFGGFGASDDSCSSISAVAGIPGGAISSAASTSPSSDFAKRTAEFFEMLLEDALSVNASSSCFFEVSSDGEAGVWMAYDMSEPVGSNASSLLTTALSDEGISTDSSSIFSANSGDGSFTGFGFESLPSINANAGGFLWLSGSSAVVVAGTDFGSGDSGGTVDPPSGSTGSNGSTSSVADPSGAAGEVNEALVSSLQSSLGTTLELEGTFNASTGGTTTVSLTYSASPSISGDTIGALTEVIEGFGGEVDFSFSAGGGTTVNFTGATIAGFSVGGILASSADGLTAALQVSE